MPRIVYWNFLLLLGLATPLPGQPNAARAAERETLKPRVRESGQPAAPSLRAELQRIHA